MARSVGIKAVLHGFLDFFFSSLFGKHLDIHSGGRDLLYPHHENELAQSEAFHAVDQWANYWLHFGVGLDLIGLSLNFYNNIF
jgi:hypothetical protein